MRTDSSPSAFWRVAGNALFVALALTWGCSRGGPTSNISSAAFDSAPADVKQLWSEGIAAWKGHRYPEAATNFILLQAKSGVLSTNQTEELTKAKDEFGKEVFAAAEKGDDGATQAIKVLRTAGGRRS